MTGGELTTGALASAYRVVDDILARPDVTRHELQVTDKCPVGTIYRVELDSRKTLTRQGIDLGADVIVLLHPDAMRELLHEGLNEEAILQMVQLMCEAQNGN